ncbi:DUF6263 family protein [uncultured Croceitalea sp.]|uniref:DUF6263 family protein n=1 Tax=uncultured Croceitalea sp. TaxID=1798908 RepID=UPI003305822E
MQNLYKYSLICFIFIAIGAKAQQNLGYQLKVGDTFQVRQQAKQLITQKLEGTEHEMTNDLSGFLEFKVDSVTDTGYAMTMMFKDFGLTSSSSIQGTLMDVKASELVEGDIMSEMFHGLLNYELHLKMAKNGSIIAVEGGEGLINKMISAAGIEDEFTVKMMEKSLGKDFSSNGLAKSFEQMTFFYPDGQVAIGDTWENTYEGKLSANNTFTLEKIENGTTSITGESAVTMDTNESGTIMSLSGAQEMLIEATTTTGLLKKMMVSSKVEGFSKMAQMGDVEIPTTIDSTITYEITQE